eukprot:90891-Prorocentrum_minimum.AAC.2
MRVRQVVEFDDVRECLVSVPTAALQLELLHRLIDLLRPPAPCVGVPPWGSNGLRGGPGGGGEGGGEAECYHREETAAAAPVEILLASLHPPPPWLAPGGGSAEALWAGGQAGRHRFARSFLELAARAFPRHRPFRDMLAAHCVVAPGDPAVDEQASFPPEAFQPRCVMYAYTTTW